MPGIAHVDDSYEWLLYVRISDDREGAGLGVKRQEEDGRRLAEQLGGKVIAVLADNDLTANDRSGRYRSRPEYDRMCDLLRAKPGRCGVISWHTDRLHRTPRELEDFIDLVEQTGAEIQTVKAGYIDLSTASGRMTARVHCAVARHESEHKSERIRRKTEELAAAGTIYGGGPRPFGYNRIYAGEGPGRKILRDEINPVEAEIVRECTRRLLAGDRLRSVVKWLNDSNIKSSTGRRWSQQALRIMMRSGRIAGLREHRRQVVGKAVWEPIITVEQHEQLRALLAHNKRASQVFVRLHHLTGYVFCSSCLEEPVKMQVARQAGRLKYKCPADQGCNGRVIGLAELEHVVEALMVAKLSDERTLRELAEREHDVDSDATALLDKIHADERRLTRLQDQLLDGDEDEIPEVASTVRAIRRRIEAARHELGELASMPAAAHGSLPELAERWESLDVLQKHALVGVFIKRIIIHPGVRGRSRFDPDRIQIEWAGVAAPTTA